MKRIFIICTVRNATEEYRKSLESYVKELEAKKGHSVHLPHRDTNQNGTGLEICTQNMNAIKDSDEVHIFYNPESQGTHFDMGMAFAMRKKVIIVDKESPAKGKSFHRMITEWENNTARPIPEKPKPPLSHLIREGTIGDCEECGSTTVRKFRWFGEKLGCIQPECENYYKQ